MYVYTLEQALKTSYHGQRERVATEASAFLEGLRKDMVEFPKIKGMGSAADGAKVGMGSSDEVCLRVDAWRMKIGEYLKQLGYTGPGDSRGSNDGHGHAAI